MKKLASVSLFPQSVSFSLTCGYCPYSIQEVEQLKEGLLQEVKARVTLENKIQSLMFRLGGENQNVIPTD